MFGSGPQPSHLCAIAERPGWEETRENEPLVGPAGRELWSAFADEHLPSRDHWYVSNVVKTFSKEPPTREEIAKWSPLLKEELIKTRPKVIVTVGAFAMRWFLGDEMEIDKCHGLVFPWNGSKTTVVIPTYHSSAALRMPELYQGRFRADIAAVKRYLDGEQVIHETTRASVATYDLRGAPPPIINRMLPIIDGAAIGLDLEGSITEPECLTIADSHASWLIGPEQQGLAIRALDSARCCLMHNAVRDLRALSQLWLNVPAFEDSMLAAYLLGEPQGLKTLAYRLLSLDMDDYWDLISPLDTTLVKTTLETAYAAHETDPATIAQAKKTHARRAKCRAALACRKRPGDHQSDAQSARGSESRASSRRSELRDFDITSLGPEIWPARVVSGLRRMLASDGATRSLRARWTDSVNCERIALPPEPTWASLPKAIGVPYACIDAYAHKQVWATLKPRLKREGLWECYQMDRSVIPFLARMESVGMAVDSDALRKLSTDLHLEYTRVCGKIEAILGYPLNPKAAEDVSETLFDELGVTPTKLTKGGGFYTTGDKFLEARKLEHAVIPLIIQGRELWKLKSSYSDKLPNMLDAGGRYHPAFGYTRTASGRLAETIILLIPKHSTWGKKIRKAFVATTGHMLVSCDLSQIELRALAHLSGDKELLRVFREGLDPHAITAHRLLGAPKRKEDQDESKHRLPSKKVNFGAFMGLSELGLTEQIRAGGNPTWAVGCAACDFSGSDPRERGDHDSDCESRRFFKEYFRLYRGIRTFIDERHAEARRYGCVRDLFGRKIYVSGIWSSSRGVVGRFERMAQATPVQATADGISKHWNAAIWETMLTGRKKSYYLEPYTRTHDDTVLEVGERYAEVTRSRMLKLVPQLLSIPVTADGKIGHNWGELKG